MTRKHAIAILGTLFILGAGSALVYAWSLKSADQIQDTSATYSNEEYGIAFSYPSDLTLTEESVGDASRYHHRVTLMEPVEIGPTPTEAPPALTVDIFQNDTGRQTIEEWIQTSLYSNAGLSTGVWTPVIVDGVEGISYTWDGLYRGESIVLSHRDSIVLISVTSITPEDRIRTEFDTILASFQLLKEGEAVPAPMAPAPARPEPTACTMEAKLCPDGSYVGRSGPHCEFAACPTNETSKTVELRIDQSATVFDITIVPLEVMEDSRCPVDVQCIQAGTVRVRTQVGTASYAPTTVFTLDVPEQIQGRTITLIGVAPASRSTQTIPASGYVFTFRVSDN